MFTFAQAVYGLPLLLDKDYHIKKSIITDWEWDFKDQKYTIKIDSNIKFHNDRNLTAYDFEFYFIKSFISPLNHQETSWMNNILGADKLKKGEKYKTGMLDGVKVIDKMKLEIKLIKPNPSFLYLFTRSMPSITPIEELKDDLYTFRNFPIGVGPYKVTKLDEDKGIVSLTRFLQYNEDESKDKAPKDIEIYVKGDPHTSQFDIFLGTSSATSKKLSKGVKYSFYKPENPSSISVVNFNFFTDLARNDDFRKSVYYGVNREQLIDGFESVKTSSLEMLPPHLWGRNELDDPYDLNKAKDYFRKIPEELRNKKYTIIFHSGSPVKRQYIVDLEKQLKEIGFKNFYFERSTVYDLEKGKDDHILAYIHGTPVDFIDPLMIYSLYLPDSVFQFQVSRFSNEFSEMYRNIESISNQTERSKKIKELSRYFNDKVMAIPLYSAKPNYCISDRIKTLGRQIYGLSVEPRNIELN